MPDDEVLHGHDPLAAALAALPLESPAPGGFARIEATLARRRARAHLVRGLALAASLAAIALLPIVLLRDRPAPDVERAPTIAAGAETAVDPATRLALIEQNQQLEAWVQAQGEPFDGATAYASAELEDLIGMLDVQLSMTQDAAAEDALWRQRLGLLGELASIRSAGVARLATNEAALVPATYQID
jgi:hypothetical protein